MKRIYKYHIYIEDHPKIHLPIGAEILHFGHQGNEPFIWAVIDPDASFEVRTFRLYGTGHDLENEPGRYLGTVHLGPFVWHLFDPTDMGSGIEPAIASKIAIKDGDVLLLKYNEPVSMSACDRIRQHFANILPNNKIIISDNHLEDILVLAKEDVK